MHSLKRHIYLFGALTALLGAAAATHAAEDRAASEARAGIQASMDKLVSSLKKGISGEEAAKLWYTDDLVLAITGDKTYNGMAAFLPTLSEWVKMPVCKWELEKEYPVKASGNLATAFVKETCAAQKQGEKDTVLRALYVFEKRPEGWRAARQAITYVK